MADEIKRKPPTTANELSEPTRADPTVRDARVAMNRPDDGEAFLPDPSRRGAHITANDAESFGEEFVASATAGEPQHMEALDEVGDDEDGGPFLELDSDEEIPEAVEASGEVTGIQGFDQRPIQRGRRTNARRSLPR